MSLRARMTAWIGLVLIACLGAGVLLAGLHARRSVKTELAAALEGGAREVRTELSATPAPDVATLTRLVASFDGVRHVQATLRGPGGMIAQSTPMQLVHPAPTWFEALLAPRLQPSVFAVDGDTLALAATDSNEVDEAWTAFRDDALIVLVFFVSAAAVVYLALGRALAPLTVLASRLRSIAEGDTPVRAPEAGPPELAGLARSFNAMARALDESGAENARLQAQMLTLQEEERADLARDLHDEFGPHLFAMKIDTTVIRDEAGHSAVVRARTRSLEDSISHIQTHVRDMLERLRPIPAGEVDLADAVAELIAFWQGRRPEVEFTATVDVGAAAPTPLQRVAIHRLLQEGLNNALRHARPSRVEILVGPDQDRRLRAEICNDGADGAASPRVSGAGLTGMAERVSACGGVLTVGPAADGRRWRIAASWPQAADAPARALP